MTFCFVSLGRGSGVLCSIGDEGESADATLRALVAGHRSLWRCCIRKYKNPNKIAEIRIINIVCQHISVCGCREI